MSILDQVLSEAGPGGVVVFDLDSTLLDNRPRQALILQLFGAQHGLRSLESTRPEHWQSWDIDEAMANAGLAPDEVARWSSAAKQFWRERFFTSEYCALDGAIGGAVDFVGEVRRRGAHVAYCTGRHEAMRAGTVQSFERLGFALPGDGVSLSMKPAVTESDVAFKERACATLGAIGRVVAVFDNEPMHVNIYARAFPDARLIHLTTDHSRRPVTLSPRATPIADFRR